MSSSATQNTTALDASLQRFGNNVTRNSRLAFILLGVLVAVIGVTIYLNSKNESKMDAARNALYIAQKSLDGQLKAMTAKLPAVMVKDAKGKDVPKPVSNDEIAYRYFNVDQELAPSLAKFKAVAQDYAGTRPAFEANLTLGDLYFNHGQPEESSAWYQHAADIAPTALDKSLAYSSLGYAYENTGKLTDALAAFEKSHGQGEVNRGDVLLAQARIHHALKENDKAKAIYDQIVTQMSDTEYAKTAESLRAQLPQN